MKETEQGRVGPQVKETAQSQLTHTGEKRISGNDSGAPVVIKWYNGGEGPSGREKFSNKISLEPRLEWGEARNSRESASLAEGTAIAQAPWQEWAWRGKGMEPKLGGQSGKRR